MGISNRAMAVMNTIVTDVFDRLLVEARRLSLVVRNFSHVVRFG